MAFTAPGGIAVLGYVVLVEVFEEVFGSIGAILLFAMSAGLDILLIYCVELVLGHCLVLALECGEHLRSPHLFELMSSQLSER